MVYMNNLFKKFLRQYNSKGVIILEYKNIVLETLSGANNDI